MVRTFLILSLVATLKGELITLTVVPNNLSTSTYSTDNGSAVVEITNSGTVEADIILDPFTRNPTNVTFMGGTLFYSDANSVYTPNTLPQTDNLILNFTNVSGSLGTINPNSPVDPITGALVNDDHTTGLTSGNLYAEYQIEFLGSLVPRFLPDHRFFTPPRSAPFLAPTPSPRRLPPPGRSLIPSKSLLPPSPIPLPETSTILALISSSPGKVVFLRSAAFNFLHQPFKAGPTSIKRSTNHLS